MRALPALAELRSVVRGVDGTHAAGDLAGVGLDVSERVLVKLALVPLDGEGRAAGVEQRVRDVLVVGAVGVLASSLPSDVLLVHRVGGDEVLVVCRNGDDAVLAGDDGVHG